LLDYAGHADVRQVKEFPSAAARLDVDRLAAWFEAEVAGAPRRGDAGKAFLVGHTGEVVTGRRRAREEELLAAALWRRSREVGRGFPLPNQDGWLEPVDYLVPLRARREDSGPAEIPLLAILPGERLAVVALKYVPPGAPRTSGATPLRLLLEGLAAAAGAAANRAALVAEVQAATGRTLADAPPAVVVLPTSRYWEICRRRGPQRGAAWIRELERLAGELEEKLGIAIRYFGLKLEAEPVWELREDGPHLTTDARIVPAWEIGAARLRPKPRSGKAKASPAETVVAADPTRPPRAYAASESYRPGDTIEHATLGRGVVQTVSGPGKISVLFERGRCVLVHGRPRA
jgi:hypothetical protein